MKLHHLSPAFGGTCQPQYAGGGRDSTGTFTIHPDRVMHWRHPDTGVLGASYGLSGGLAYVNVGFRPVGRRKLLKHVDTAPHYTCGTPDRWCTRKSYLRVLHQRATVEETKTFPPIPMVKP